MEVIGKFFGFVTLIAILIVVVAIINKPKPLQDVLVGFTNILGTLQASVTGQGFTQQQLP